MYRAPEMLDLWNNYPINEASDIWALGCVLYMLCYKTHPFEDSAKLRIINANYTLPATDGRFTVFHDLIRERFIVEQTCKTVSDQSVACLLQVGYFKSIHLRDRRSRTVRKGWLKSRKRTRSICGNR
jgi:cyclin G-associated kinase